MAHALIAGGTNGIGFAVAEALARRGYNLVLVGRHTERLASARSRLESAYRITVDTLQFDLTSAQTADQIAQWCIGKRLPIQVLCNVAGLGGAGDYLTLPLDKIRTMVNVNLVSGIALCDRMIPVLEQHAPAHILNVGSLAGLAPIPVKNVYSATKSAMIFFSHSLRFQLKERKINVSCLCPGPVFTKPEIEHETRQKLGWLGVQMAVDVREVGEVAIRQMLNRKLIIVPGFLAGFFSGVLRVLPMRLMASIYYGLGKN